MAKLSQRQLNEAFIAALGSNVNEVLSDIGDDPLELRLAEPYPSLLRAYLQNATDPQGGRPSGPLREHKINLIGPGQRKGTRADFNFGGGFAVVVAGKVEDVDAWVLWDAPMHRNFPHSKNLQVKTSNITQAVETTSITQQRRRLSGGRTEIVLIAPTQLLTAALLLRSPTPIVSAPEPAPVVPAGTGRPYQRPSRNAQTTEPSSRVFEIDPDKIDRATAAHKDIQDALADAATAHGLEPLSPGPDDPEFDIAWVDTDVCYVVEVKSTTPDNEERQLRLGLGQVLTYAHRLAWEDVTVQPVLAAEHRPAADYWFTLCESLGVILTWPERFGIDLFGDGG